jgi:hypothetical protein
VLHSRLTELVTKGTVQSVDRPLRPAAEPRPSRAFCSGAGARHESQRRNSPCHYARFITKLFTAQAMRGAGGPNHRPTEGRGSTLERNTGQRDTR